jgi:hypothetical protein
MKPAGLTIRQKSDSPLTVALDSVDRSPDERAELVRIFSQPILERPRSRKAVQPVPATAGN